MQTPTVFPTFSTILFDGQFAKDAQHCVKICSPVHVGKIHDMIDRLLTILGIPDLQGDLKITYDGDTPYVGDQLSYPFIRSWDFWWDFNNYCSSAIDFSMCNYVNILLII